MAHILLENSTKGFLANIGRCLWVSRLSVCEHFYDPPLPGDVCPLWNRQQNTSGSSSALVEPRTSTQCLPIHCVRQTLHHLSLAAPYCRRRYEDSSQSRLPLVAA